MTRLLLCLPLLAFAALATALPELSRQSEQPAWQQWGSAEMSRFGFRLYRATLWVAGERPEQSPTALQLDYRRDIDAATLVGSSIDEMRRLGSREEQLRRWQSELARVLQIVVERRQRRGVAQIGAGGILIGRTEHVEVGIAGEGRCVPLGRGRRGLHRGLS